MTLDLPDSRAMSDELWRKGSDELAAMIAAKEVSSTEVMQAHLDRIADVNPQLNAVTTLLADSALAAAADADRATAAGAALGRLHGVPITVKQNIDLVGSATNQGLVALAEALPAADSPVAERMKAAGAIPIGRTNCPDMGLRLHTDSGLFGLTRNPWHPDRTTGGSSGGEGSALASGMSPLGLGNDIGGSLRNPATCCGIASIKPTQSTVPFYTSIPSPDAGFGSQTMLAEGPMARRIGDVRTALGILAGRDPRDPNSVPVVAPAPRPTERRIRVGVLAEPPGSTTDPRVADVVRGAADALVAAGYDVFDAAPPRFDEIHAVWLGMLTADLIPVGELLLPLLSDDARTFLTVGGEFGTPLDPALMLQNAMARQSLMRDWALWFAGTADVLLTPAWTELPFEHGFDISSPEASASITVMARSMLPGNLLGIPSACVPAAQVDGLPVGVLVNADRFRDDLALDVAEAIEAACSLDTPIDPR